MSPRAPAQGPARARRDPRRHGARAVPLAADRLLPAEQGPRLAGAASFFTTDPTGNTFFKNSSIGGIKSAILGTIEIVALASAIAIPIGIGVAVWLVEYGRDSRFAQTVRFFVDVLTGVPSIVFGLFIYIVLIVGTGSSYAGYKGSLALALLMLPVVIRSAEVVLLLVPGALRESALALGRAALAGDLQRSCCRPRCRAWSPACCWRSRAPPARPRRCCSRRRATLKTNFNLGGS